MSDLTSPGLNPKPSAPIALFLTRLLRQSFIVVVLMTNITYCVSKAQIVYFAKIKRKILSLILLQNVKKGLVVEIMIVSLESGKIMEKPVFFFFNRVFAYRFWISAALLEPLIFFLKQKFVCCLKKRLFV